jgi:hypothetical protein
MVFPTRSASGFVLALPKLWTGNPVCRRENIRPTRRSEIILTFSHLAIYHPVDVRPRTKNRI